MNGGCCNTCEDCFLVPTSCLLTGATPFTESIPGTRNLKALILNAQNEYVIGILQPDCFEELCEALAASVAESPVALPAKWEYLIKSFITPLIQVGSVALYVNVHGVEKLTGITDAKAQAQYVSGLTTRINGLQSNFKAYLEANTDTYSCVPVVVSCAPLESYLDSSIDFEVAVRFPKTLNQMPPEGLGTYYPGRSSD